MDLKKIEYHVRGILEAIGEDVDREGLKDTPKRVARMYEEVFSSISLTNDEIADILDVTFDEHEIYENKQKDMVFIKDIDIFSYCEHHMALMYNMKVTVGYLPKGRVIGLSKIARIAQMVSKRLQLQERIGNDILYIMKKITGSDDVAIMITGDHSCMTARGVKNIGATTVTTALSGKFETDGNLLNEFLTLGK